MTYEQLQKNVKYTETNYEYAVAAFMNVSSFDNNHTEDIACSAAYGAWSKARRELTDYLKEL